VAKYTAVFTRVVRKPQGSLLMGQFDDDVQKAIQPDDTITRYNRTWRFSRPQRLDGFLVGKLGFVREAEAMHTYYDEQRKDFVQVATAEQRVQYSHWALQLEEQLLVFLKRAGDIDVQSFVGAFRALLDRHPDQALTVEFIVEPATFFEWAKTVQRVVRFHATVRPPNPHWTDRTDRIRELIERTNADQVTLDATTAHEKTNGLHVDGTILEDIVEYQSEGYSAVRAEGFSGSAHRTYDSKRKVETRKFDAAPSPDDTDLWQHLIDLARRR
jgi:hypothetical protein